MADPMLPPNKELPKPKDSWDKLDIIGKLLSGIALALIAILINCQSQRIADSLKNGQLTQSLVDTILKQDMVSKRDLALIALDETIGDNQRDLVCRVCAQVAESGVDDAMSAGIRGAPASTPPEDVVVAVNKVARQILKKRLCKQDFLTSLEAKDRDFIAQYRTKIHSQADPNVNMQTRFEVPALIQAINKSGGNTVYVQYREDWQDIGKLKDLHDALDKHGFTSPRKDEKIGQTLKFKGNVRYFYAEDQMKAQEVLDIVKMVFGKVYTLTPIINTKFQPPHGQIEVWCSPDL
jgi:hypothetical protein